MGGDDLLGNPQAQPTALAPGREVRLEDLAEVLDRHPRTGVADFQNDHTVGRPGGDFNAAAAVHGLEGIDDQVQRGLD